MFNVNNYFTYTKKSIFHLSELKFIISMISYVLQHQGFSLIIVRYTRLSENLIFLSKIPLYVDHCDQ